MAQLSLYGLEQIMTILVPSSCFAYKALSQISFRFIFTTALGNTAGIIFIMFTLLVS